MKLTEVIRMVLRKKYRREKQKKYYFLILFSLELCLDDEKTTFLCTTNIKRIMSAAVIFFELTLQPHQSNIKELVYCLYTTNNKIPSYSNCCQCLHSNSIAHAISENF